jgi:restriction system protein
MAIPFLFFSQGQQIVLPRLTIKVLTFGGSHAEGQLVAAAADPWFAIIRMMQRDPQAVFQIGWRELEEIVGGAWRQAGFDEVILTPRSGDRGRDVIATRRGVGSIRLFDQVKTYSADRVVTAEEVQTMLGVISSHGNVSKGIITTTSEFAPRLMDDPDIKRLIPFRLELKPRDVLLQWLTDLADKKPPV